MAEQATCRSCGAVILWAVTKAGKRIPLDAEPCPDGNVFVVQTERGLSAYFPTAGAVMEGCARHKSHFATCPDGPAHRRKS
jgi:hypothetical protein